MQRLRYWLPLLAALAACKPDPQPDPKLLPYLPQTPAHFPPLPVPADNPMTLARVELGKALFYDPLLSRDRSISCASCHLPELSFSDPNRVSIGVQGRTGTRNAPALINLAYHTSFFWDGSNPALETQALFPIEAHVEMDLPVDSVVARLRAHPSYPERFIYAFNDSTLTIKSVTDAIASFERTLLSYGSKYDRFIERGFDSTLFSPAEWRGYKLFFAEKGERHAECFHCHGGYNFDEPEGKFRNNGLYYFYEDPGRYLVTGNQLDVGKFKVPTLRNLSFTAPYMHDGSLSTLEEVVAHYASGGQPHLNRDILMDNILITAQDQADIIAFLMTLNDTAFVQNPAFRP